MEHHYRLLQPLQHSCAATLVRTNDYLYAFIADEHPRAKLHIVVNAYNEFLFIFLAPHNAPFRFFTNFKRFNEQLNPYPQLPTTRLGFIFMPTDAQGRQKLPAVVDTLLYFSDPLNKGRPTFPRIINYINDQYLQRAK